jgi:GxxExxY protein
LNCDFCDVVIVVMILKKPPVGAFFCAVCTEGNHELTSGTVVFNDMIKEEYRYSAQTARIIRCAMTVHSFLGNGFQEVIYQRALEIEMSLTQLAFAREFEMPIYYRERAIGVRRVDFLVENVISVELKAIIKLEDVHLAQAINYLEAYNLEIGLLINFGAKSMEVKRLSNKKFKPLS